MKNKIVSLIDMVKLLLSGYKCREKSPKGNDRKVGERSEVSGLTDHKKDLQSKDYKSFCVERPIAHFVTSECFKWICRLY